MPIICAAFLALPLYPLNPTAQDTVNSMNLHITTGVISQSGMISAGPELTLKFEYLLTHPFIFRSSLDFTYGEITTRTYPNGSVHRQSISSEVLYYRGTKKMTGYLGIGVVYGRGTFKLNDKTYFDNNVLGVPQDIKFGDAVGYRFVLGMRFQHKYSIEVGVTEISPSFIYTRSSDTNAFSEEEINFQANYVKVSLGYLFRLK